MPPYPETPFDDAAVVVAQTLASAASEYLRPALRQLHEPAVVGVGVGSTPQVIVGLFGVALELLLKAAVAEESVLAVYKQVPSVVRVVALSTKVEQRTLVRPDFVIAMRDGTQDMIEFAEAAECVYLLCPFVKKELHAFLSRASEARNKSVHNILPRAELHHAHRLAYAALRLLTLLRDNGRLKHVIFALSDKDKQFVKQFNVERAERVKKAMTMARDRARSIEPHTVHIDSIDDRNCEPHECPVCRNDGVLSGSTDSDWIEGEMVWTFFADGFECETCGLALLDTEELRLAGLTWAHER